MLHVQSRVRALLMLIGVAATLSCLFIGGNGMRRLWQALSLDNCYIVSLPPCQQGIKKHFLQDSKICTVLTGPRLVSLMTTVCAILVLVVDRVRETRQLAKFKVVCELKCVLREQLLQVSQSGGLWTAVAIIMCVLVSILLSFEVVKSFISDDSPSFTCSTVERSRHSIISAVIVFVD